MESDIEIINRYFKIEEIHLHDADLEDVITVAKASKDDFLTALKHPKPQQSTFMVLTRKKGKAFWVKAESKPDSNEPPNIAILEPDGIKTALPTDEIWDWGFVDNGFLKGGFSIKHLFEKMPLTPDKQDIESHLSFFITPMQFDWNAASITLMQLIGYQDIQGVRRFHKSNPCKTIQVVTRRPLSRKLVEDIPLNYAIIYSNLEMLNCLVGLGHDINDCSVSGVTPLFMAASAGKLESVEYLCERGAKINAIDERGLTPLAISIINNHEVIANFLLDAGASTGCVDEDGATLLHLIASDNVLLTEKLVSFGTQWNQQDDQGDTPLHCAAINGFPKILRYLVSKGSSLSSRNNNDESSLDLVRNNPKLGELIASELIEISRKQSRE